MSAVVKLAMLVLKQAADRYEAEREESRNLAKRLREREGTPAAEESDDYETGYAEGRASSRREIARDLRSLREALEETLDA